MSLIHQIYFSFDQTTFPMTKTRLEAFSDGVLAIIITIMVLELKVPHGTDWDHIQPLLPVFLSYIMSFVFVAIYWGNHHHLMHTVHHVNSKIIWANNHLLFWLSLIPFATAWMGENGFERISVVAYAVLLNLCGVAYFILQLVIQAQYKESTPLTEALEKQKNKGLLSLLLYSAAIPLAFVHTAISALIFIAVAILWIVPDKNIEKALRN